MRTFEQRNGCGVVCVRYREDDLGEWFVEQAIAAVEPPAYTREPSFDDLRLEALRELERADLERGIEIPPRNPGKVEGRLVDRPLDSFPWWAYFLSVIVAAVVVTIGVFVAGIT